MPRTYFASCTRTKCALVLALELRAGRAVGLVADDEVEVGQPMGLLRLLDDLDGVVGRVDDAHVLGVVARVHLVRQSRRVGRRRVLQLVHEGLDGVVVLRAPLPDVAVGADGEVVQTRLALLRPLRQGLGEQGEAGDQEQHPLALAGDLLGDLEAGEGLAGAARHDELAAVGGLEPCDDRLQRVLLVRPKRLLLLQHRCLSRREAGPVDDAVLERRQIDLRHRRVLAQERRLGVIAPEVRRADDDPVSERLLAGGGEEAVDVCLLHAVVRRVQLALDRVELAGEGLRDEVDPGVALVDPLALGPLGVRQDVPVELAVRRLGLEVADRQLLEVGALLAVGHRGGTESVEEVLKSTHADSPLCS